MAGLEAEMQGDGRDERYRRILLLGQGGTADVHLAVAGGPAGFRKLVVLKQLKPALSQDPELRAMFLNEARLAARLQHPNVVQTYDVLDPDAAPVIVMEFLDGQPLSNLIVRGRDAGLTLALQLRALADALVGLHAAHELRDFDGAPLGVVHRDISPHNLFVTVEGQSKVLDFGIAKLDRSLVETEVGTIKGKLRYMAPEQLRGDVLDRRADIYAAGVILWEALAGERMWRGVANPEIRARVGAGELPDIAVWRPDAPAAIRDLCRRALARDPERRPATALAVADELEAALPLLPGGAPSRRALGDLVVALFRDQRAVTRAAIERALAAGDTAARPARPTSPTRPRRWRLAMAAGVTLAAGLLVAARTPNHGPAHAEVAAPISPPADVAAAPEAAAAPPPAAPIAPTEARVLPRPERTVARRGPRRTVRAAEAPKPAPDCAHPFFVDADGIKKFRPECM